MAATKDPETIQDLLRIVDSMENNVISTGTGNLPLNPDSGEIQMYFKTAVDASMSKITDPLKMLDSDLVNADSPRLRRLATTVKVAKEKTRFASPKTKEKPEPGTTIHVGNTIIRPMPEEGIAR